MKNIIFDFDGVIIDSVPIRNFGFYEIFKKYPKKLVEQLVAYHIENLGLSRFVKIRYFFHTILKKDITKEEILEFSNLYSSIMLLHLNNKKLIIQDTLNFIQQNYQKYNFHIASGSEQNELRLLNDNLNLSFYFHSIHGSPIPKIELVKIILKENQYKDEETVLIGDSINDYDAAIQNNIRFFGYNNVKLKNLSSFYIKNFQNFKEHI